MRNMNRSVLIAVLSCMTALPSAAVEWTMLVEAGGVTNTVKAGDGRYAIDVTFTEKDGAWSGSIVNREKGAIVLGFEVMSEPMDVVQGKTALYVPRVYGRRIRNWPEHGVKQPGSPMWTEREKGVFVPFVSPWDCATGSRPVPLPFPSKICTMQWSTLNDGDSGFYLASEDPLAGAKDIQIVYDSNVRKIRMGFLFPMHIGEGVSYSVPRVVMKRYSGAWRVAAKMYRTWWNTCRKVVSMPDSVRENFTGFFLVILKQQNGDITWPYTDFEGLGKAALAHGMRHVEFHGWGVGGHDNLYPEYDPDPAMGGKAALVAGVKKLQEMGLHVSVYSNGQLQQRGGTKWYEEKGYKCPIMKRDGTPMGEHWIKYHDHPGVTFDVACPSNPDWRAQMIKICRDAKNLGFQGFFYDQIGKQWPGACFDARHGHRPGEFVYTRDRETMLLDVLAEMRKTDPDFVLWSESFNDTILNSVALYEGLAYVTDRGYNAANRFVKDVACDLYPEMTFYTFPELVMTDRNSTPLCTRKRVNGCAATNLRVDFEIRYRADRDYVEKGVEPSAGFYDNVYSKPGERSLMKSSTWRENRDYLRRVSDFRRENGRLLLTGTFKADEGFSVKTDGDVIANRWDGPSGESGILVWNAGDRPVSVDLTFDKTLINAVEPERGDVNVSDPIPANSLRLYKYKDLRLGSQNPARIGEIQAMLRPEAGFPETRIENREFWDKVAAAGDPSAALLDKARKIVAEPMPVPDDSKYEEYGEWTRPLQKCKGNLTLLTLAECIENKGSFLPKIIEYLEMFSTRRCWTGRYHDRQCLSFNGKIHIVELGNGMIAQDISVVLDVLRNRLPADVRARALAAMRKHCLDTYLGIARDYGVAKTNRCGWVKGRANWNAACNEYMVSAALHVLDDPAERAEAIELAERSTRFFISGYTEDGMCKEGSSYWDYGFGQYMRLCLWVRKATGGFLSFVTPFEKKAYLSYYGSCYNDNGGPSYGDCNNGNRTKTLHVGTRIWPEFDRFGAHEARFLAAGLSDFTLRSDEFKDPKAFMERKTRPHSYPVRSWYPSEVAQLVCRPSPEKAGPSSLYAAIQGGYNARPHGHHDIGSYCIAVGGVEVMGDPGNAKYDLNTFGPKRFEHPMRNSFGHPVPKVDGHLQSKGAVSRAYVREVSFSDARDYVKYDMKDAYRTVTGLTSLTRSLEYLRDEGKVVVTDKVSFKDKGTFETALMTYENVDDLGEGTYLFTERSGKKARCKITVTGSPWHVEKTRLGEDGGSQFPSGLKGKPLRVAVVLDGPVHEAEVKVVWEAID